MARSAAVLCQDKRSLQTLNATLEHLGIELAECRSSQHALELAMIGQCSTLIVDFDMPGAREVIRIAGLLPAAQKPILLALESRAWPGTGQAFQSGASRILYKPIDSELIKECLRPPRRSKKDRRKSERFELRTLVYLELPTGTLPAISIDVAEQGMALQAIDPVPVLSDLAFRCVLPGAKVTLHGHADVMWASDQGRAGLFFSRMNPSARRQLKDWLAKRGQGQHAVRDLLPSEDAHVSFAAVEDELEAEPV